MAYFQKCKALPFTACFKEIEQSRFDSFDIGNKVPSTSRPWFYILSHIFIELETFPSNFPLHSSFFVKDAIASNIFCRYEVFTLSLA